jgi:uncharacterized protein (DUF58 family)
VLAVLLVPSLLAPGVEALRPPVVVADLVLLGAVLVDLLRTPSPARLRVGRRLPPRAGLGVPFERVVRVEPGPAAGLLLELREEFSPDLEPLGRQLEGGEGAPLEEGDPTGGPDRVRLRPGENRLTRSYRGRVRGVKRLGALRLRLRGPLGLVERQTRLDGEQSLVVEPPLADLDRVLRLAVSERWQDLGVRRLRRRGGLTEFESLREYVRGDDPRLVDQKAYARRGTPIVREFQEERGQELLIAVDAGRRMGATTTDGERAGWTKLDHALDAGLELAAVALQAGDRVGFAVFDRALRAYVPPARGARQLGRIKEAVFGELPSPLESDLARALRELSVHHRRRALLLLVTDAADPLSAPAQRRALSAGSRRHALVVATLDDPSVRRVEAGELPAPAGERASALALAEERRGVLAELRRSGARVLDALPAESAGALLGAWLDARRGRLANRA